MRIVKAAVLVAALAIVPAAAVSAQAGSKHVAPAAKKSAVASHTTAGTVKSSTDSSLVITKGGKDQTFSLTSSTEKTGTIANGAFQHASFTVPVPAPDGPATLAVRPEALDIVPASSAGMGTIHRVTDFGTHALIDIELPDGFRLKSMVSEARDWQAGQAIDLKPRAYAVYRDNRAIHRSAGKND